MRPAVALGLAFAVLGGGCSNPEANLLGEWRIVNGLDRTASTSSIVAKQFELVFKADKTYTMGSFVEGTYAVRGHSVTLTVTKEDGITVQQKTGPLKPPTDYTLSDDGKSLTTSRARNPMKFVRVAAGGS